MSIPKFAKDKQEDSKDKPYTEQDVQGKSNLNL